MWGWGGGVKLLTLSGIVGWKDVCVFITRKRVKEEKKWEHLRRFLRSADNRNASRPTFDPRPVTPSHMTPV